MSAFSKIWELEKEARREGKNEVADAYMICIMYMEEESIERSRFMKKVEEERAANALELAKTLVTLYEKFNNNTNK